MVLLDLVKNLLLLIKGFRRQQIQSVDLILTVGGPPRDMVLLFILLGLAGIRIFLTPTLVEKAR